MLWAPGVSRRWPGQETVRRDGPKRTLPRTLLGGRGGLCANSPGAFWGGCCTCWPCWEGGSAERDWPLPPASSGGSGSAWAAGGAAWLCPSPCLPPSLPGWVPVAGWCEKVHRGSFLGQGVTSSSPPPFRGPRRPSSTTTGSSGGSRPGWCCSPPPTWWVPLRGCGGCGAACCSLQPR